MELDEDGDLLLPRDSHVHSSSDEETEADQRSIDFSSTHEKIIVKFHDRIFDIGSYLKFHPGTGAVLKAFEGRDITAVFENIKHSKYARKTLDKLYVGEKLQRHPENFPRERDFIHHDIPSMENDLLDRTKNPELHQVKNSFKNFHFSKY